MVDDFKVFQNKQVGVAGTASRRVRVIGKLHGEGTIRSIVGLWKTFGKGSTMPSCRLPSLFPALAIGKEHVTMVPKLGISSGACRMDEYRRVRQQVIRTASADDSFLRVNRETG